MPRDQFLAILDQKQTKNMCFLATQGLVSRRKQHPEGIFQLLKSQEITLSLENGRNHLIIGNMHTIWKHCLPKSWHNPAILTHNKSSCVMHNLGCFLQRV